jgi:hypothetical protein
MLSARRRVVCSFRPRLPSHAFDLAYLKACGFNKAEAMLLRLEQACVWLKYELFRGRLSEDQYRASEADLSEYVRAHSNTKPYLPQD